MNLDHIEAAVREARRKKFESSDQLCLGAMINLLTPIAANQKPIIEKYGHEATVHFDFEYLFPCGIDSWRGSYDELAIDFALDGQPMTVSQFLALLVDANGKTFTGYKGGEYQMNRSTPVWVARYGNSGNTAVVGIVDNEYSVILQTGQREF